MKTQIKVAVLRHKHTKRLVDACVIKDDGGDTEVEFKLEITPDFRWDDWLECNLQGWDVRKEIKHHEPESKNFEIYYETHEIEIK